MYLWSLTRAKRSNMPAARVSPINDQRPSVASQATTCSSGSGDVDNRSISSTSLEQTNLTSYQRILHRLNYDDKWQKEITLGRRVGFYRLRGDLGSGNFSQVKAAIHCLTKDKVAVKILDKAKLDQKTQRMLSREITSMEALHHPHIIRLYEVIETLTKIYLVMEYANGGELFYRISTEGKFSESEGKLIFAQVTAAVEHMHQHRIIHRDLKAENVFFAGRNIVKVGDFGFSTQIKEREEALSTFCGSPPYAAPELFKDESYIGHYVDIWALGVLLYFVLTATMPFKAQTVAALKNLILEGKFSIPTYLSENCSFLICGILRKNPQSRFSIEQIKDSNWLKTQHFPEGLAKYNMQPSSNGNIPLTTDEEEARQQLKDLGITDKMMRDSAEKGARSNVTGAYRIVLHKLQCAPLTEEMDSANCTTAGHSCKVSSRASASQKKSKKSGQNNKKSRTCAVL